MVGTGAGAMVLVGTLVVFALLGVSTRTRGLDVETFTLARGTQPTGVLGLSFLASGMGAWILFAPPQVGAQIGLLAVVGYGLGAAAPIALFGFLGVRMRRIAPAGVSLPDFLRTRFGAGFHRYITGVSLAYMLLFLTAELTGVSAVVSILAGIDPRITVLAVAGTTLAYTAYAGLPASLRTDRWQAWLILALLAAAATAIVIGGEGEMSQTAVEPLLGFSELGLEAAVALIIAVTTANLFHHGYWQRVWAARDDRSLRAGALLGAGLSVPVVLVVGGLGVIAAGRMLDFGSPPTPLFALLTGLPAPLILAVLVLALALVCSSVDTLENGLAALIAAERPDLPLSRARLLTMLAMAPAVLFALQGYDVLRLFLIADLLCAATAVPAMLGLWGRATTGGALAGSIAGLVGALTSAILTGGSLTEGLSRVTFPAAAPTLPEFAGALVASTAVAVGAALVSRRPTGTAASDLAVREGRR